MGTPKNNRKAKRLETKGLRWDVQAMSVGGVQREDGAAIGLNVLWDAADQVYIAVALSVPNADAIDSLEGVLDDHAHRTLGHFETETEAKETCKAFAIEWLKSGDDIAESCECKPIELTG